MKALLRYGFCWANKKMKFLFGINKCPTMVIKKKKKTLIKTEIKMK